MTIPAFLPVLSLNFPKRGDKGGDPLLIRLTPTPGMANDSHKLRA